MNYQQEMKQSNKILDQQGASWNTISPEYVTRMRLQNRFRSGVDIARYTAGIMREDMAAYERDPAHYTQSL
ncbi:MAG TPA: isocitrate lyase, partial [Pseudohongiella sp.]|nr:isocitrate lyase [Pseudohongiella sp.]